MIRLDPRARPVDLSIAGHSLNKIHSLAPMVLFDNCRDVNTDNVIFNGTDLGGTQINSLQIDHFVSLGIKSLYIVSCVTDATPCYH
jgi:hypothetical protein